MEKNTTTHGIISWKGKDWKLAAGEEEELKLKKGLSREIRIVKRRRRILHRKEEEDMSLSTKYSSQYTI